MTRNSECKSWACGELVRECQRLTGRASAFANLEETMESSTGSLLCSAKGSQIWTFKDLNDVILIVPEDF